jgi:hypothetical protein
MISRYDIRFRDDKLTNQLSIVINDKLRIHPTLRGVMNYQNSIMALTCNKYINTLYALLKNTEYDKIPLAIETWYTTLLPLVLEEAQ